MQRSIRLLKDKFPDIEVLYRLMDCTANHAVAYFSGICHVTSQSLIWERGGALVVCMPAVARAVARPHFPTCAPCEAVKGMDAMSGAAFAYSGRSLPHPWWGRVVRLGRGKGVDVICGSAFRYCGRCTAFTNV